MLAFPISIFNHHIILTKQKISIHNLPSTSYLLLSPPQLFLSKFISSSSSSCSSTNNDPPFLADEDIGDEDDYENSVNSSELVSEDDEIEFAIEKIGKNSRRIKSSIAINASLCTVWSLLTDYERLSDFIPSLAVSQLLQKSDSFARLYQIGEQDLAFGLKFNAKGVVDCYERDLEILYFGLRRDIEFKMIEGDFQIFEGRWSIVQMTNSRLYLMEQNNNGKRNDSESSSDEEYSTRLSYVVEVMPKMWLPVGLVEGRLCREIKTNLSCVRDAAHRASQLDFLTDQ